MSETKPLVLEPDGTVFRRCPEGREVIIGKNILVTEAGPGGRILCHDGAHPVRIPETGRWMAVSFESVPAAFGVSGLTEYRLSELPGRIFRLGFYGTLRFVPARLDELRRYMAVMDSADPNQLIRAMMQEIRSELDQAVASELGTGTDYKEIRDRRLPGLAAALEPVLFIRLFRQGICMIRGSFHIENLSRPVISA